MFENLYDEQNKREHQEVVSDVVELSFHPEHFQKVLDFIEDNNITARTPIEKIEQLLEDNWE